MKTFLIFCLSLSICLFISSSFAASFIEGELPRRADLGFSPVIEDQQLVIRRVKSGSLAEKSGVKDGDVIVGMTAKGQTWSFANSNAEQLLDAQTCLWRVPGGKPLKLTIKRKGKTKVLSWVPDKQPLEKIEKVDSYYDSLVTRGGSHLRTIVSVPEKKKQKLPAIFFVQWVSCGSIEYHPRSASRELFAQLLHSSGRALVRVDRAASGDSQGPACHQLGYDRELQDYVDAFKKLSLHPMVDKQRIIIWGSSLGSTLAPLIAVQLQKEGVPVEGVMIQGGGAVTYLERMLAFDRIYLERRTQVAPESIHQQMLDRHQFQYEYLVMGKHPDDIASQSPAMKAVRNDILGMNQSTHYGRPYLWHQQAAKHNFLAAWHQLEVPVLVVFNEFDQFESEHGHRMIVDMINRWRPGSATFVKQTGIGHSQYRYSSIEQAYQFKEGSKATSSFSGHLSQWLKRFD
ncbi:hypothetical protein [Pleionea sp. CnH1-48]|uniref:hypothetical protein n=1 Tax=Pleionea sp. CnH1-48 TaxID=2954494 RepID=UPI002096B2B2|nr:hypothetical protein [Pleionea sp. CnH1-48]MCO7223858.1 hypothetical protein [Pleionea sp. CnH1-48]